MKRLLYVLTLCLVILSSFNLIKASDPLLIDQANLLSESEESSLLQRLEALETEFNISPVIITIDSLNGQSSTNYADDYYDYHSYLPDGILFLISITDREYAISTTGSCINTFTDYRLASMEDAFIDDLSYGDYYNAFYTFIRECDSYLGYTTIPYEEEPYDFVVGIGVSLGVGFVISLIVTAIMRGKLKTIRRQRDAHNYMTHENMTGHQDIYLYRHVSRTRKPEPKSSGSSTHFSSSGRSHGGRSGRF